MVVFKIWPIYLYASMVWLNTDFLIPILKVLWPGTGPLILALIVMPMATLELCYGYWFWAYWIRRSVGDLQRFRQLRRTLHQDGLLDKWIIDRVLSVYRQTIDPGNKIHQRINRWGAWFIWIVAVLTPPGVGARSGCAAFCGLFRQNKNFIHLIVANLVHALLVMRI